MKNLLAVVVFSILASQGVASLCAQQAVDSAEVAELKSQVAALKQRVAELEKDYYDVLSENMQRQNKLRAEIRRLKEELEEARELNSPELSAAAALPPSANAAKKEAFDKESEYRNARLRAENKFDYASASAEKPAAGSDNQPDGKNKQGEKQGDKQSEKQGGSSFWDNAFPF